MHDFTTGSAATFLKRERQLDFSQEAEKLDLMYELSMSDEKVHELPNGVTIHVEGTTSSFLLWYKNRPNPNYKLPKYHVLKCETMKAYGGYVAANSMPVPITLRNQTTYENLVLCKNCQGEIYEQNFLQRTLSGAKPWYDVVLTITERTPPEQQIFSSNGYLSNWRQVSQAYRQSVNWRCENPACRIDLSNPDHHKYLHTHHLRGTKHNSRRDLKALCLLCHAMEHSEKMVNGSGVFDVQSMVTRFRSKLDATKVKAFDRIVASINDRFGIDCNVT